MTEFEGMSMGVHLAIMRFNNAGDTQILLLRSAMTELFYPGEWQCPGALRRGEQSAMETAQLIRDTTLAGLDCGVVGRVRTNLFTTKVGREASTLFALVCKGQYEGKGEWFSAHRLPANMPEHHLKMSNQAFDWVDNDHNWMSW